MWTVIFSGLRTSQLHRIHTIQFCYQWILQSKSIILGFIYHLLKCSFLSASGHSGVKHSDISHRKVSQLQIAQVIWFSNCGKAGFHNLVPQSENSQLASRYSVTSITAQLVVTFFCLSVCLVSSSLSWNKWLLLPVEFLTVLSNWLIRIWMFSLRL